MERHAWDYSKFKTAFYLKTGLELDRYKDKQMERRIRQLMERESKPGFQHFYNYLVKNPPAMQFFLNYLTINTSEFFRDQIVYARLKDEVFPELLKDFDQELAIWSAGCSFGAEPYTVAILFDTLKALHRVRVVGTDIDEKALQEAKRGKYHPRYLVKIPPGLLQHYFIQEGEGYCIKPIIQKSVTFKRHNLLCDTPLYGCHMILCRNVFIYFKVETQDFFLQLFSSALKAGGYLVIGSAEYISNPEKYMLKKRFNTIYQKITG